MSTRGFLLALGVAASLGVASADEPGNFADVEAELEALRSEMAGVTQLVGTRQRQLHSTLNKAVPGPDSRYLQAVAFVTKDAFDAEVFSMSGAMDSAWLVLTGGLVMIMHAGFAMLETGCCRVKNAQNVLMKNLLNVCVGTFGWYIFGWGLAYGGPKNDKGQLANHFIGTRGFANDGFLKHGDGYVDPLNGEMTSPALSWFFQWAFCTAGATIVSGGVAERVKSPSYAVFAFVMAAFIYPVVAAWTWGGGWLNEVADVGYMDFAGSGIVHLTGGISALAGTVILGPRKGRFENPEEFEAHSLPLVVLGTFILWLGWYGFNPGSTLAMHSRSLGALAAQIAMNTTLAAATGGITVFAFRYFLLRKYDVGGLCNGILAGLVSVTAGAANVEAGSAILIGIIGSFIYQGASMLLVRLKIDDPVDAVPVHCFCGAWGVLAVPFFDWGEGFNHYNGWNSFDCMKNEDGTCMQNAVGKAIGAQVVFILAVVAWAGTWSSLTFFLLKVTKMLRVDDETEHVGMDMKQHSPAKAYTLDAFPRSPVSSGHSPPNMAGATSPRAPFNI